MRWTRSTAWSRLPRPRRADARRNQAALLDAAAAVFVRSGVEAPVRDIAAEAGVGTATIYRHFPTRADLIIAVYRHQVEACAKAGPALLAAGPTPYAALGRWIDMFVDFLVTKHGLAAVLRGDSAGFASLHSWFLDRLVPVCARLLDAAADAGEIRSDIKAFELMRGVGNLCVGAGDDPATTPGGWPGCSSPDCASPAYPGRTSPAYPDGKRRERISPTRQYLCVDEKLRSGPIEAPADFADAFREHFAPVYRFIARRVGTGLAEDLAAEAFATAYRRRASYDPVRGSVRSWLFGIAANVLRGHWRDEQELLELDARLTSDGTRSFDTDADSRVAAAALMPRIAGALAALNPEQRDVLLLHAWADLSHEEIAAALGIANGTARSRLSRARAALRAQLGEFDFTLWTFKENDHA